MKGIKDDRGRIAYEAALMESLGAETCVTEPSIKLSLAAIDFVMDVTGMCTMSFYTLFEFLFIYYL